MKSRLLTEPLIVNTSVNNTQTQAPGFVYPTQNAPTLTYAGGRPLYAQTNGNVQFNNITTTGSISFIDGVGNSNVLSVVDNELQFDGAPVGGGGGNVGTWSEFPAITNVGMGQHSINNVSSIVFKSAVENILTIDSNNDLTYNGSVLQVGGTTPSTWADYPAVAKVQMDTNPIANVGSVLFNSETTNILTTDEFNRLTYNGDVVTTGGVTPGTWANYPAISTINASNNNMTNANSIFFKSDVANILTIDGTNQLTYNGSVVATGGVTPATWANYPAVNDVTLPNKGINISPGMSGYPNSQMDTNLTIGKPSYLLFPNINFYPATFGVGSLAAPATTISFNTLGPFSVNSVVGIALTGGGGVSIIGGGGITAVGATITLGAGEVSAIGGSINLGAGTINMAGGLINALGASVNVGAGLITATSGGVLVTSGSVVVGTADINGAGIVCYGGKIQCATSLAGGTGGLEMNGCPITGVSTINGTAYPPTPALMTGVITATEINGATWTSVGTFGQYEATLPLGSYTLTTGSIVMATLHGGDADESYNCWIVTTAPTKSGLRVVCASDPTTANINIAWLITLL